jgi:hypothetical protein
MHRNYNTCANLEEGKEKEEKEAPPYPGSPATDLQTQRSSSPVVLQL